MSSPRTPHLDAPVPSTGQPSESTLLNAGEVAELLSVPKSWVYAETRAARLPFVKIGRYYRYARPSIEAWIAGLERGPVPYRKYAPGSEPGGSPHA